MKNRARLGSMGWGFLVMVFLLGGCSSTPPVAYYTLNTLPEMQQEIPAAVMDDTIAIGVGPVEFPKFLDRPCPSASPLRSFPTLVVESFQTSKSSF